MNKRMIHVDLKGKNALVTGGAKGIGAAISSALAANHANVAINYHTSRDRAEALVEVFRTRWIEEGVTREHNREGIGL